MKIRDNIELDNALLDLGRAKAQLQKEEAAMNEEIQKITEKYSDRTAELSGEVALMEDGIEKYCTSIKNDFASIRTRALNHGVVGFRTNPPSVKQLNKKWKVESSIAFLKKLFGKKYLREKPEINRESILADFAGEKLTEVDLAGAGLRIEQEETFICEPNWVELKDSKAA